MDLTKIRTHEFYTESAWSLAPGSGLWVWVVDLTQIRTHEFYTESTWSLAPGFWISETFLFSQWFITKLPGFWLAVCFPQHTIFKGYWIKPQYKSSLLASCYFKNFWRCKKQNNLIMKWLFFILFVLILFFLIFSDSNELKK